MKNQNSINEDEKLAQLLRNEILKSSQQIAAPTKKEKDLSNFELISNNQKAYVSPIFSMSEDEILDFVEEFDVGELATLTPQELNHIGEVLGADPKLLVGKENIN